MANWYGTSRSNYFKVKDAEAFKAWAEQLGLGVWTSTTRENHFAIYSESGEGWPSSYYGEDDNFVEVDIGTIAEHLAEGEVAVLVEAGAEKLRYVTGWATAIAWDGRRTSVSIDDIYAKARAEFGVEPGLAEY